MKPREESKIGPPDVKMLNVKRTPSKAYLPFSGLKGRKAQNHKKIGLKNYSKIDLKDFLLDFRKILRNKVTT